MSTTSTGSLEVSKQGIIQSLRDQFTDAFTWVREAAQNARRAGASYVAFDVDDDQQQIVVTDDGHGIDDPQALLSLGQSGWPDLDAIADEHPFGMGFAACLFAASHIHIESSGWAFAANTADILAFKPVAIHPATRRQGTRLVLTFYGECWQPPRKTESMGAMVRWTVDRRFQGFPIAVYRDGALVDRSHAFDANSPDWTAFDCGYVAGLDEALRHGGCIDLPSLYLQGLPVTPVSRVRRVDWLVVHLDHTFRARVPDRDILVDAQRQEEVIIEALRRAAVQRLVELKAECEPIGFVAQYGPGAQALHPELLDDMPVPETALTYLEEPLHANFDDPVGSCQNPAKLRSDWQARRYLTPSDADPALVLDLWGIVGLEDEHSPEGTYAWVSGLPVMEGRYGTANHWLRQRAVDLATVDIEVQAIGAEDASQTFFGHAVFSYGWCQQIRLKPDHSQLAELVTAEAGVVVGCHEVLIPLGESCHLAALLQQIDTYRGEFDDFLDVFLDVEFDEDLQRLEDLRRLAKGEDGNAILAYAIAQGLTPTLRAQFAGQTRIIHFDEQGRPTVSHAGQG